MMQKTLLLFLLLIGIIAVGDNLANLSASSDFAAAEEKKFATNKERFSSYINQLK